jgi:hypothetical protein
LTLRVFELRPVGVVAWRFMKPDCYADRGKRDTMVEFVLLACPGCTFSHPVFLVLSIFAGSVPTTYLLLRPYTRSVRTWGVPRIDMARFGSLVLMLLWLVPLWFIGRQEHSVSHVAFCIGGLSACCIYLWLRSCWLLDTHHVATTSRELLFPGLLTPALLVLGTTIGSWVLGILLVAPVWPMILVPHTIWSIAVGAPIGLLVYAGLNYTFPKPETIPASVPADVVPPPPSIVSEPKDEREPE